MISGLHILLVCLLGYLLLVFQATMAAQIDLDAFTPNLLLPLTIYLGVSPRVKLVRGALAAFALGYLLDTFCGNRISLQTFMLESTFLLARGAGLRIFLRGPALKGVLTFIVAALVGAATLMLRAIFEQPAPFSIGGFREPLFSILAPAISTAVAAPPIFGILGVIEHLVLGTVDGKSA